MIIKLEPAIPSGPATVTLAAVINHVTHYLKIRLRIASQTTNLRFIGGAFNGIDMLLTGCRGGILFMFSLSKHYPQNSHAE